MNEGLLSITRPSASAARQARKNILPIRAFPVIVFRLSATERKSRVAPIVPKAAGRRTEEMTLPLYPNKCPECSRCARHLSGENSAGQRNSMIFVYRVISGCRGLPFLRHLLLFLTGLDGLVSERIGLAQTMGSAVQPDVNTFFQVFDRISGH